MGVLKRWGLAVAVMAVIFIGSSMSRDRLPDLRGLNYLLSIVVHVLSYGLLAVAYLRGLAFGGQPTRRQMVGAVILAVVYGLTDEYHQSFTGRSATAEDIVADFAGAVLGVAASRGLAARGLDLIASDR